MNEHNCIQEKILGAMQEQIKTLFISLNKQEGLIQTITDLTIEIRGLATETKATKDDIGEVKKDIGAVKSDVAELKNKPAKRWDGAVDTIIKVTIGGVITFVLFKLGLGV